MRKTWCAVILLLVTGCATSSPGPIQPAIPCETIRPPALLAREWAALSEESAMILDDILAAGEVACGW